MVNKTMLGGATATCAVDAGGIGGGGEVDELD
jgi:hypothetical protein